MCPLSAPKKHMRSLLLGCRFDKRRNRASERLSESGKVILLVGGKAVARDQIGLCLPFPELHGPPSESDLLGVGLSELHFNKPPQEILELLL